MCMYTLSLRVIQFKVNYYKYIVKTRSLLMIYDSFVSISWVNTTRLVGCDFTLDFTDRTAQWDINYEWLKPSFIYN